MDHPLVVSLIVTGVGMLILFLALALLYGLMVLMTTLVKDRRGKGTDEPGGGKTQEQEPTRRRAAAIAVALARAEQELSLARPPREGEAVSPWRALHHHRQLTLNLRMRRGR